MLTDATHRGYYPRGMGLVELSTLPVQSFQPLVLTDPGKVIRVKSRAFVAGSIPIHVRLVFFFWFTRSVCFSWVR